MYQGTNTTKEAVQVGGGGMAGAQFYFGTKKGRPGIGEVCALNGKLGAKRRGKTWVKPGVLRTRTVTSNRKPARVSHSKGKKGLRTDATKDGKGGGTVAAEQEGGRR